MEATIDHISKGCSFSGCTREHYGKGYCNPHYQQWHRGKELKPIESVPLMARNDLGEKRCSGCATWFSIDQFGRNNSMPDNLANTCRECQWSAGMYSKYRIRGHEYLEMLESQNGTCAICYSPPGQGCMLAVDHDHACCPGARSCGKCIRKLLCFSCNVALGNMHDDPKLLRRAADYLEEYRD